MESYVVSGMSARGAKAKGYHLCRVTAPPKAYSVPTSFLKAPFIGQIKFFYPFEQGSHA